MTILFIMFQGSATPPTAWNEGKSKFLNQLKKIGEIYTYQNKLYNIFHYLKNEPTPELFPNDIDFKLSYLDMKYHLDNVYQDIIQKYKKYEWVPVGWSAGGYMALAFSKLYKKYCKYCILLDSAMITKDNINLRLKMLKEDKIVKGKVNLTNKKLKKLQDDIRAKKKTIDIEYLLFVGNYYYSDWIKKNFISEKISIPTYSFIDLEYPDDEKSIDFNNKNKIREIAILSKKNPKKYTYHIFVNEGHQIFYNRKPTTEIINFIKNIK